MFTPGDPASLRRCTDRPRTGNPTADYQVCATRPGRRGARYVQRRAAGAVVLLAAWGGCDVCGLCGIVDRGAVLSARRRGGDARGARAPRSRRADVFHDGVALGYRRLAIIDLTDGGHQPFASDDGALQLVHNGEIYNYRELRARARGAGPPLPHARPTPRSCSPRTASGASAASSASTGCGRSRSGTRARSGSSARATASASSRSTTAATAAGSSSRASRRRFAADPRLRARAEPARRARLPRAGVPRPHATRRSSPASAGCRRRTRSSLDRDGLRIERYWQLEPREPPAATRSRRVPRAVPRLGAAAAAQRRPGRHVPLRRDRLVGDRVAVDHLLAHRARDARRRGRAAADVHRLLRGPRLRRAPVRATRSSTRTGARAALGLRSTRDELVDELPAIVDAQDEPFGSTSIVAQWFVMRAARGAPD